MAECSLSTGIKVYQFHEFTLKRPNFRKPIIIRAVDYVEKTIHWLLDAFEKEEIPYEIKWMSFEEATREYKKQDVDIFIHGEIFETNQNLSFFYFLQSGKSPLGTILQSDSYWKKHLELYSHTPFQEWSALHHLTERKLIESSILIPIYYEKREIPFSSEIRNLKVSHFGYIDLSKIWVRTL